MDASDSRYPVVQELMAYWLAHPRASDSLEGICRWWLTEVRPQSRVAEALSWLVASGVVATIRTADGRSRYRLARHHRSSPS